MQDVSITNDSQLKLDVAAARSAIETIRTLDLNGTSIDEIKELLTPIFRGYVVKAPCFNLGLPLYSGRLGDKSANISELSYPPARLTPIGLANRPKEPVLYCCTAREAVFFELQPKVGDTVALAHWVTTAPLMVNYVGYTRRVLDALGSTRPVASWGSEPSAPTGDQQEIMDFLSDVFTQIVPPGEEQLYNKLTVAVAENLFAGDPFDGLLYPSVRMRANADNIALKRRFVDDHLRFLKAEFIRIDAIREFDYDITLLDTAPEITTNGTIEWYIVSSDTKKLLSRRYGTVGWQEFLRQKKDILSNYDSAKENSVNRPVHTEHGSVAEASFRKWLSEYLPKKYSVTSGYIIPDVKRMNYVIRHYDVIIYDVMNAPVLWGSNNPDESEQGRARAIPAKYVHAVFEVKAALTKASINEAVEKLKELNEYEAHLPLHFISAAVFFELRQKEQSSCKLAEGLYNENIPGYFGGLILRAEGFDPNLTGYYQFYTDGLETINTMPLIRDIDSLQTDDQGNPQLTKQGDTVVAYAQDDVYHFDKGYSAIVKNVNLLWAYNSFPMFFIDLLERLQGTYDPTTASQQGSYGLSFNR